MALDVLAALPEGVRDALVTGAKEPLPQRPARPSETDPLLRQLDGEAFALNDEQAAINEAVVGKNQNSVIRAAAGTGKTTTLEALAKRFQIARPGDRILYIAFNRSVRVEADERMPINVESRTGHSLAWKGLDITLTGKIGRGQLYNADPDLARSSEVKFLRSRPQAVAKALGLELAQAETVRLMVDNYAISADDELTMDHLEALASVRELPTSSRERLRLLESAQRYWDDVSTPLGRDRCKFAPSYDHLRKMWALTNPNFTEAGSGVFRPAKILFVDEAQDTPPVLARIIDNQPVDMQLVAVGDSSQAIYGFSGAISYLDEVAPAMQADLPLTTSYRFGSEIAGVANRFLEALDTDTRVVGNAPHDEVGEVEEPDAVLTRTNRGMIEEIITESSKGRSVGLLSAARQDLISLVSTTAHLRDGGPKPEQSHRLIGKYQTWADVMREAEAAKSTTDLTVALGIVTKWPLRQLAEIAESTREVADTKRSGCDVVITTTHQAKGLEWDTVRIAADHYGPDRKPPGGEDASYDDPEHLRLAYVAVTRAKKRLDLGSLRWILNYAPKGGRR